MEEWIRTRAIDAYRAAEENRKCSLRRLFYDKMLEIVGIDIGYVDDRLLYRLDQYEFTLLDPSFCEAFMGFPTDWTLPTGNEPAGPLPAYVKPESAPSETASSPPVRNASDSG